MISNFVAANARFFVALLAASTALAAPTQAKDQPASPAAPNEVLQATHSVEHVIAIPVPLPLPGQLKQFPQRTPPHAAGRSRPSQSRPTLQDRLGAAMEAARVQPERTQEKWFIRPAWNAGADQRVARQDGPCQRAGRRRFACLLDSDRTAPTISRCRRRKNWPSRLHWGRSTFRVRLPNPSSSTLLVR